MKRIGCELIIHDHDLWVTMVGWVDVQNSDQGYFLQVTGFGVLLAHPVNSVCKLILSSIISCWTKSSTDVFLVHPHGAAGAQLSHSHFLHRTAIFVLWRPAPNDNIVISTICHQWCFSIKAVSTMMSMYTSLPHTAFVILRTIDVTWIITTNKTVGNPQGTEATYSSHWKWFSILF